VQAAAEIRMGQIEGVRHERLAPYVDHRGTLTEVVDLSRPFWDEPVVYAYRFTIRPGGIKGWGRHRLQTDRYFVVSGDVRVVLHDARPDSSTGGLYSQHYFNDVAPGLLSIPPGVWHAAQNWGDHEAAVLNFPTVPFDHANPDKERIDPHSGEIAFDWTLRDG
jgi:dTDP-4-dehydrorhamnose 3,5-epimerase